MAKVQFNRKLPQKGTYLTVKWGSTRSLKQNSFYFVWLSALINDYGLRDKGFFCVTALHEALKAACNKGKTTTMLTKGEFVEYMDRCHAEIINSFFEIDDSAFWMEYQDLYAQEYGDYMKGGE